jgi:hypothetical protein
MNDDLDLIFQLESELTPLITANFDWYVLDIPILTLNKIFVGFSLVWQESRQETTELINLVCILLSFITLMQ